MEQVRSPPLSHKIYKGTDKRGLTYTYLLPLHKHICSTSPNHESSEWMAQKNQR